MSRRFFPGPKLRKLIPCGYCFEEWADCYDHIKPVAHGGTNRKSNLYPACRRCNLLVSAKVFKSLSAKRDFVRIELKKRGEWHSGEEMQRMRGSIPAEETTPDILFNEMPVKKVERRETKKQKLRRERLIARLSRVVTAENFMTKKCENCGKEFTGHRREGRDVRRFCSARCRVARWSKNNPRVRKLT